MERAGELRFLAARRCGLSVGLAAVPLMRRRTAWCRFQPAGPVAYFGHELPVGVAVAHCGKRPLTMRSSTSCARSAAPRCAPLPSSLAAPPCATSARTAAIPTPNRHRSRSSISVSRGNPDRRPPVAVDGRQARTSGRRRALRTPWRSRSTHPQDSPGPAATPLHPASCRSGQVETCFAAPDDATGRWTYCSLWENVGNVTSGGAARDILHVVASSSLYRIRLTTRGVQHPPRLLETPPYARAISALQSRPAQVPRSTNRSPVQRPANRMLNGWPQPPPREPRPLPVRTSVPSAAGRPRAML